LTLIQEFEGKEHVIYYISRRLLDAETRYSVMAQFFLNVKQEKLNQSLVAVKGRK